MDALHRIEQQFLEGLRLIERTQFSIQGPEQSDLMGVGRPFHPPPTGRQRGGGGGGKPRNSIPGGAS